MEFPEAFARLIEIEGGYSNHPNDPGGATMWGVTEAVARRHGYMGRMEDLPLDKAKEIFRASYWQATACDLLPPSIRYAMFDAAVNSGSTQAIMWLQRACGVKDDGIIGRETLAAVRAVNLERLQRVLLAQRLRLMTDLKGWKDFGRGWARRICTLLED